MTDEIRLPNRSGRYEIGNMAIEIHSDEIIIRKIGGNYRGEPAEDRSIVPYTREEQRSRGGEGRRSGFDVLLDPPPLSESIPGAMNTIKRIIKNSK